MSLTMLWRLPAPVRALLLASPRRGYSTAPPRPEPLRILFCGSDDFSIASLHALHDARRDVPGLIDDIHVVHRPAKPTGRGRKTLRPVPLEAAAQALSLPTHALDTFTHWTPPVAPSLIIAVSFGLLIPARLLALAPHGGLNVHPSLLPDLRGAAPIPRAILAGRTHTGVSVQTLHPRTFDAGTVLAQTPAPGVSIAPDATAEELRRALAPLGARMLVDVLRTRKFVAPLSDGGWYAASGGPVALAPKTRKADACVEFGAVDMARVTALLRALGHVWCVLPNGERLVVHGVAEWAGGANAKGDAEGEGVDECKDDAERHPGLATRVEQSQTNTNTPLPSLWPHPDGKTLLFRTACGRIGAITSSTYPGGPAGRGNKMALRVLREHARL